MTRYRWTELALSFFLVILGAATVVGARYTIGELKVLQDVVGARGFAYVVGSLVFLGGAILAAMQLRSLRRGGVRSPEAEAEELGGDDPRYPASTLQAFAVFAALVAYAWLLKPAGYIPATVLFVGAGTWIMGGRGLVRLFLYPLAYAIGTYLLFDTVLGVRIPDGVLRPLIRAIGLG
jgi:putative tricarboxylic transport membrane protein